MNSPHKGPVTRKMFPFDDVIMESLDTRRWHLHYAYNRYCTGTLFPEYDHGESSNGNIFRVTGLLWGESPNKGQLRWALRFSLNKRLSKQSRRQGFETPSHSLWRHCSVLLGIDLYPTMCGFISQLTYWGRNKMAAISQTMFSNAFSWMKMCEFRLRFHWSLFPRV